MPRVPASQQRRAQIIGAKEPRKPGQPDTLAEYITTLVRQAPDGVFTEIAFDGTERSRTYGDLFEEAQHIADSIAAQRPGADAFALLCFDTVIDYVPAAWACLLNNYSFLPLSTADCYRGVREFRERTRRLMGALRAPLVLTEGSLRGFLADAFKDNSQATILDTRCLPPPTGGIRSPAAPGKPGDILVQTSGTTGGPRLARLGGDKIINRLFDGSLPDRRVLLNLLVHTSVGGLRLLLPLGRHTIYLKPSRLMANPRSWLDCVTRFGVTDAGMSSAMAAKINEIVRPGSGTWDTSSLARLAFGSEMIVPSIIRRLVENLEMFGMRNATAFLVYSMTETGPLFSSQLPARELVEVAQERDGQFILSRCAESWSFRVVRESGEIAELGELGRIEVRSESRLFRGYHPQGEGISGDGWFDTGDLGSLTDQGLVLAGREKSTIVINARKIAAEDVERCLSEIDGIKSGFVFAAPFRAEDSATDELVVFFTPQSDEDANLATLVPKVNAAVARSLGVRVRHLVRIAEDDVPRTATGKVKRSDLVAEFKRGRLRSLSVPQQMDVESASRWRATSAFRKSGRLGVSWTRSSVSGLGSR